MSKAKKLLSILLTTCLLICAIATMPAAFTATTDVLAPSGGQLVTTEEYQFFITNENTVTIYHYFGSESVVTIPSEVNGFPVTEISQAAFYDAKGSLVTRVILPESVTTIDQQAFRGCNLLKRVDISSSVTSIGQYAFFNCPNLKSVWIPQTVASIGQYAFGYNGYFHQGTAIRNKVDDFIIYGSSNTAAEDYANENEFTFISVSGNPFGDDDPVIPDDNDDPEDLEDWSYLINDDYTITIDAYYGENEDVTVPSKIKGYPVSAIQASSFYDCDTVVNVIIPDSVKNIGDFAFSNCNSLESVTIGSGVINISTGAFRDCKQLRSVTITAMETTIGSYAFGYYMKNYDMYPVNGFVLYGYSGSSAERYAEDYDLTFIDLGSSTIEPTEPSTEPPTEVPTELPTEPAADSDFKYWVKDSGTAEISNYTGSGGAVTIPSTIDGYTVSSIGDQVFYYRTDLTSITIPDSVTSIGNSSFYNCTGLTSVTIPGSVTDIAAYAFYNCTGLTKVAIGNNFTRIGDYAFYNCPGLLSVMIGDRITRIGNKAFGYRSVFTIDYPIMDFTIYGFKFSEAQWYANNNGFTFIEIHVEYDVDQNTGISVELYSTDDLDLSVETVDAAALQVAADGIDKLAAYDITLNKDGAAVQPDGTVKVKIPCDNPEAKVYRVEADGSLTDMNAVYQDGYLVFTTDHFSVYLVAVDQPAVTALLGDVDDDGFITVFDASSIQKSLAKMSGYANYAEMDAKDVRLLTADVDGDGNVSIFDASLIQKYLAKVSSAMNSGIGELIHA